MVRRATASVLVVLLLGALAGCSRTEDAAQQAIAEAIMANQGAFGMDQEQADCVAQGLVEELGTGALRDAGILAGDGEERPGPIDMSPEQAERAARVVVDCGGIKEQVLSELPEASATARECVDGALTEPVLRDYVASVLTRDRARGERQLQDLVRPCLAESSR